jgi:hypothetical protein
MFISATQSYSKPVSTSGINYFMAAIWFLYLVLKPVYLMPHGLPQLSDAVLAAGLIPAVIFMFLNARPGISPVTLAGGLFVALTVAINLVNYIFIPDKKFIFAALYYPYNFTIFLFVVFPVPEKRRAYGAADVLGNLNRPDNTGYCFSLFSEFRTGFGTNYRKFFKSEPACLLGVAFGGDAGFSEARPEIRLAGFCRDIPCRIFADFRVVQGRDHHLRAFPVPACVYSAGVIGKQRWYCYFWSWQELRISRFQLTQSA